MPKVLWDYWRHGKYRRSLKYRLGVDFPYIEKRGRQLLWVHTVSVGEVKAAAGLIKKIKAENPQILILVSVVTETGYREALKTLSQADYHVYLPLDLRIIISPIVKRCSPDIVIVVETDFWYNFLSSAKKCGAKLCLVNGKLSSRSQKRYRQFWWIFQDLFNLFDIYAVQGKQYRQRFIDLGVDGGKVTVTGNLKLDDSYPSLSTSELEVWRRTLGLGSQRQLVVLGSTHPGEEELLLEALADIPDILIAVVPRHPERFEAVADLLKANKLPFARYSSIGDRIGDERVILVDAMGVLRNLYQLATIAVVGGSFVNGVGGHNILEPLWYGTPVVCGPYMYSQPDFIELLHSYHAGEQVEINSLRKVVKNLLGDQDYYKQLSNAGKKLWQKERGAVERTYSLIEQGFGQG
ncbi:MAG: 3-deoxy-D-manno-octulosonic acid transferase [Chlamydiota bacterium]